MSAESAIYKFPSPGDDDVPNAPLQFAELADAIDATKWLSRSVKLTAGVDHPSGALSFVGKSLGTYYDVPGLRANIVADVPSLLLVGLALNVDLSGKTYVDGTIKVDSNSEDTNYCRRGQNIGITETAVISAFYAVGLTGGDEHTIQARARTGNYPGSEGGFPGLNAVAATSSLAYLLVAL